MSRFTDALDALVDRHRRLDSSVPEYLRPGLAPPDVRSAIGGLGLDPTEELVELFAWHDGLDTTAWPRGAGRAGFPRIWGDAFFAPLTFAIETYRESIRIDQVAAETELRAYGKAGPATWNPEWFPAFSGGDETYAVDCGSSPDRGLVFDVWWHPEDVDNPTRARFKNLTRMMEAILRRFDEGTYSWNPEVGWFDIDDATLERLKTLELEEVATGDQT
jgi:hypothetical protein